MRTELLEAFMAVAEEQHFGRAADRLHIGQSPLSQQIRRLEAEIGTPLFARTTRRVELTAAGSLLLERVPGLLGALDDAAHDARRAAGGEVGRVALGFTGSATFSIMPLLAAELRRELPDVRLELHGEQLTPAQVERLVDGRLDLGLLRPPVRTPELEVEVVRSEPLVAVLPAGHALADSASVRVADLADEPFVTYPSEARSVLHEAVEATCRAHGFFPRVAAEVGETGTLVAFVAAGLGVSLAPQSVTGLSIAGAVYRPLADERHAKVDLAIAWRRGDRAPALLRALDVTRRHLRGSG